jgi:hypothetical protein
MKPARIVLLALAAILLLPSARGQETQDQSKKEAPPQVPLKIQLVIDEFDGTKKVSSLPYTLYTMAVRPGEGHHQSKLRYNIKVPIRVSGNYNIENVGTGIDCAAYEQDAGEYQLEFGVTRTWIPSLTSEEKEAAASGINSTEQRGTPTLPPPMPSFEDSFTVVSKNGQTVEGVSAVDPITGHVLKIDVTLTVLK